MASSPEDPPAVPEPPAEPEERELKFRCRESSDLSGLRERLEASDAERLSASAKEVNWILDRAGELKHAGRVLRVRFDGAGNTLTFKGPARFEGGLKIRVEREVSVGDHEEALAILEAVGFEVSRRYEKFRETWRQGGVIICLDHTPIGDFVEFEGPGADRLAVRFGFEPAGAERSSYLELYDEHRLLHPEAPEDMVFS